MQAHPYANVYMLAYVYARQRIWIPALNVKSTSGMALLGRICLWGDWSLFFMLLLQGRLEGLLFHPSWDFCYEAFIYLNTCPCTHPLSCLLAGRCYKLHREIFKVTKIQFWKKVFSWWSNFLTAATLGSQQPLHKTTSLAVVTGKLHSRQGPWQVA